MKVLMLNYEFPPIGGGGGQAHLNLLRQYAGRSNLKIDVLTCAPQRGFETETFASNVTIHKVGIRKRDLHYWRRTEVLSWLGRASLYYRWLIRRNDYDLAHAFFGFPTGWLCYRQADRLPYIISLRGSDVPGLHGRLKLDYKILAPVMRAIWRRACGLVACSEGLNCMGSRKMAGPSGPMSPYKILAPVMRAIWRRACGLVACSEGLKERALQFVPSAWIHVIPNGVDLGRFKPVEGPRDQDTLRLLTVGRLSVTKRVEVLVDAIEVLHKGGMSVRLTVVGGGALETDLRRLVTRRGLDGLIEVKGRVDAGQMPRLYQRHDVFVSATMQEGMSNAMLEAMASGLPIVTTRCEGVNELIADNGIVVDGPPDLARAIEGLDPGRLHSMAAASRQRAERFTWSAVADRYIEYYRQVLGRQD